MSATIVAHPDQSSSTINPAIYGHFAEHLGRCVYEGLWVGENSPIPNTRGIRNDVVAALKNLHVPVLRWPGGCFADEYHWRDGIGPRDQRPRRINSHWGGVIETNAFGTHEFLDLCDQIGCDAYIAGNMGSGTMQEMMDWVEYLTSDSDSTLAQERRKNGREKPWKIKYFGVGNESWGCGGNMTAEYYADEFRRYATFVKDFDGNKIERIASGPNGGDYDWTQTLMNKVGGQMQGLSLHYYTLPTGKWNAKGSATNFDEPLYFQTLKRTLEMDELIKKHSAIMDERDPKKQIGLVVDEWGTWYDPEPGDNPGFLYQQNSLRDAIVAGINLNIFNHHCDRISMANLAQMANVLQAVVLTDKERMLLTPTYHVLEMYKVHQGGTLIPIDIDAPKYALGGESIPSISASASRDAQGGVHVTLVNLDPNHPIALKLKGLGEKNPPSGRTLTAEKINTCNTFDAPHNVEPKPLDGLRNENGLLSVTLPAKSVSVIDL